MSFFHRVRGVIVGVSMLALPSLAWAAIDANSTGLRAAGSAAGLGSICSGSASECLATLVGRTLNIALSFIGILLVLYVLYAGFLWMSAGGDDKQVKTAKDTIKNAVIGLVLLISAFAISTFVLSQVSNIAGTADTGVSDTGGTSSGGTGNSGSSGGNTSTGSTCSCGCSGGGEPLTSSGGSCSDETFCSQSVCTSRCSAGGLEYVRHSCAATPAGGSGPQAPAAPLVCNCECNVNSAITFMNPSITGTCAAGPSGNCQLACTSSCSALRGTGRGLCEATRHADNRTPREICEGTPGIGNPTYLPPRPEGQLENYRSQCEYCMRSNLIERCMASLGTDSDVTRAGTPSLPAIQGQITQVCDAVCRAR